MSGFIVDLLEGIADFFTDVWLLRRQRAARGRGSNRWGEDAADVAVFNGWVIAMSILALAAAALLFFAFKLPLWLSLAPIAAGGVYVGYRWMALVRA